MKKLLLILLLLPLFIYAAGSQQATYILEKVTKFHKKHNKISGEFELSINGKKEHGLFFFFTNGNRQSAKLFFGTEDDLEKNSDYFSYWIIDKNKLWVYLQGSRVLVEQAIPEYFNTIGFLGTGLSQYFASYKNFHMEEILEPKTENIIAHRLSFSEPTKPTAPFTEMSIEVREDGFQESTTAISLKKIGGKTVKTNFSFKLYKVNLAGKFDENKIFRVNPSGNVQILRNVLLAN